MSRPDGPVDSAGQAAQAHSPWQRWARAWQRAWRARHELAGPSRLADEVAFLPAALSLQETPLHPAPRRLAWAIIALFVAAVAWAVIGRVDMVAVANGRLVVSDRSKQVQPLTTSVVKAVLVKEGDSVAQGQPLVELDPTAAGAERHAVDEQGRLAQADALRYRALLAALARPAGTPPVAAWPQAWTPAARGDAESQLRGEWADITARMARLSAEAQRRQAELETSRQHAMKLEGLLPIAQQREADARRLADQGFLSGHQLLDRKRERSEIELDLATQRARIREGEAALAEAVLARSAYIAEAERTLRERLAQADLRLAHLTGEQMKAAHRQALTTLRAPVAGTVQQLAVHTPGGVVTEAQTLMVIVPHGAAVRAEVMLENRDVGFVHAGQMAEIKLEAFPFTRHGTVRAVVDRLPPDAVVDERRGPLYAVALTLEASHLDVDGRKAPLVPGMSVTAEIRTGERRLIEFLLSPLQRTSAEALRER